MLENKTDSRPKIWLNAHAFAENVLNQGRVLRWQNPIEFAENYQKVQGIVGADRLSIPLMGFLDYWLDCHPHVLQEMAGKRRVRFAIKKLLTNLDMRTELTELVRACCAMVKSEVCLELPSNSALISWAHGLANPEQDIDTLTDIDIDSTSVYLADTVRQLKSAGISGLVITLSDTDIAAGAAVELYQPIINVSQNYRWHFAFRRPLNTLSHDFESGDWYCLGDDQCSSRQDLHSLTADFWKSGAVNSVAGVEWYYSELPAFAEPEVVRRQLAQLSSLD